VNVTSYSRGSTYDLIVVVTDLLAHQLVRPLFDLLSTCALDSGDDERHGVCRSACKRSLEEGSL
jgi:hypothetical protein